MKEICILITIASLIIADKTSPPSQDVLKTVKLPPCAACKVLVNSFQKGIEKTERGKYEGGDADWEEKKLSSYKKSEVRLVEIQELLCKDLDQGEDQCLLLAEEAEHLFEAWWLKEQDQFPDLLQWLCTDTQKVCCPDGRFGPNCIPCVGYPDQICSNNGKCRGAGTRKGNGTCSCDTGYAGSQCNKCADTHYEAYRDETKLICSRCHAACDGKCLKAGPAGCEKCSVGWMQSTEGCIDVNECVNDKACEKNQFCVNSEGSFKCLACDRACDGCTGDGPDMCIRCISGYIKKENMCVDTVEEQRTAHINLTRYLTYLGLCIATCIIFQRSVLIASIVGLAVGLYISASEYMLSSGGAKPLSPNVDASSLLNSIL